MKTSLFNKVTIIKSLHLITDQFKSTVRILKMISILLIGFPPEFVKAFKNGFPYNWLSLVADFFNSQSRLVINLFN